MEIFLQMLNSAKKKENDAIAYLYQQFCTRVFRYMASRISDQSTAEDLTSEVFLKMVEGIHKVKATDEATFKAWLFRIVKNVISNFYQEREQTSPCTSLDSVDDAIEYLCILEDDPMEMQIYLAKVFRQLTQEQRVVLMAILMMDYDAEETGRIMGKNTDAVRALKSRAITSLRRILEREDYHG